MAGKFKRLISLDALRDREFHLLDDYGKTQNRYTPVDRAMEDNYGDMGEDSEGIALWEERARKVLSRRPIPSYFPY